MQILVLVTNRNSNEMWTLILAFLSLFGLSCCQWQAVGNGVHYRNYGYGPGVLITYAGWSVSSTLSQHWAERIMQRRATLPVLKHVGHVYAVQGPRDASYSSAEIGNSKLVQHLLGLPISQPDHVIIAAHSSGAFVANEFFAQFHGTNGDSRGKFNNKLIYFNLDGGGGLDAVSKSRVKQYFVYARSGSVYSMNGNTMVSLGNSQNLIEINGGASGCFNSKCLHDTMVNEHPWNPYGYDLEKDYGLFAVGSHEVQTYYMKWISAHL